MKLAIKLHGSFFAILGAVALLAEFNPTFATAKAYCLSHAWALWACYVFWYFLYGLKELVSWKVRLDLAEVREENRKRRRK